MKRGPLAGITLVETGFGDGHPALMRAIALAGRIAADLGADVLRAVRPCAAEADDAAAARDHIFLNAGKTLVVVDDQELAALLGVVDGAIVDAATARRIGQDRLSPAAAIVSFAAGDDDATPHSEFTAMAASGLLDLVGDRDRAPLRMGGTQLSYSSGLAAYGGLVSALCVASSTGPQRVTVNLHDVGMWLNWKTIVMAGSSGKLQTRAGRDAEWQVVRCADGWVAVVYRDADWPKLKRLVNDPRLDEARFGERTLRRQHGGELAEILEGGLLKFTRAEIRSTSRTNSIPLGAVWSPAELMLDAQNQSRLFFVDVADAQGDAVSVPRLPVLWNGQGFQPRGVPSSSAGKSVEVEKS